MLSRLSKIILGLCLLSQVSYADEVVSGFEEKDLPVLNEELRKKDTEIKSNKDAIATATTNIATLATAVSSLQGQSRFVQLVHTMPGNYTSGGTAIPWDNSKPEKTEGVEFMTLAITPQAVGNVLVVDVVFCGYFSRAGGSRLTAALFKDDDQYALASGWDRTESGCDDTGRTISFRYYMTTTATAQITFKVRAGTTAGDTVYFNGDAGSQLFDGTSASSITIHEFDT